MKKPSAIMSSLWIVILCTQIWAANITISIEPSCSEPSITTKAVDFQPSVQVSKASVILDTPMNYPNPFKPSTQNTTIRFNLSPAAEIKLLIYALTGRPVHSRTIAAEAGYNRITWDGRDQFGRMVGNGVYVYFISSGGKSLGSGEIAVNE